MDKTTYKVTIPKDHVRAEVRVSGLESHPGVYCWRKGARVAGSTKNLLAACREAKVEHLLLTRLRQESGERVEIDGDRLVVAEGEEKKPFDLKGAAASHLGDWLGSVLPSESREVDLTPRDVADLLGAGLEVEPVEAPASKPKAKAKDEPKDEPKDSKE